MQSRPSRTPTNVSDISDRMLEAPSTKSGAMNVNCQDETVLSSVVYSKVSCLVSTSVFMCSIHLCLGPMSGALLNSQTTATTPVFPKVPNDPSNAEASYSG